MKGEKSTGFEGRRILEETNERESDVRFGHVTLVLTCH